MESSNSRYLTEVRQRSLQSGEAAIAARQLWRIYEVAMQRSGGTFLELGTDRGQASRAILAACEQHGGRLVSVDVRDCSGAAESTQWTFVQSDSTDRDAIVSRAPILQDGIDMIYLDSLHTPEHVQKEVYTWFGSVREGGSLFFDDVDSAPYMRGRRKDNPLMEIDNRKILALVQDIFYANIDQLRLTVEYGSTGLARLEKISPIGTQLKPPVSMPPPRRNRTIGKLMRRFRRQTYTHKRDGSDFI